MIKVDQAATSSGARWCSWQKLRIWMTHYYQSILVVLGTVIVQSYIATTLAVEAVISEAWCCKKGPIGRHRNKIRDSKSAEDLSSINCRDAALAGFHRFECRLSPLFERIRINRLPLIMSVLRSFTQKPISYFLQVRSLGSIRIFFVVLACYQPVIDGLWTMPAEAPPVTWPVTGRLGAVRDLIWPDQAAVQFPLTSVIDKSERHRNKFSGTPSIIPGATGWKVFEIKMFWRAAIVEQRKNTGQRSKTLGVVGYNPAGCWAFFSFYHPVVCP